MFEIDSLPLTSSPSNLQRELWIRLIALFEVVRIFEQNKTVVLTANQIDVALLGYFRKALRCRSRYALFVFREVLGPIG